MRIHALALLPLAVGPAAAQWSLGASGWFSIANSNDVRFGPAVCSTFELEDRWRIGGALGMSIPTRTKVDRVMGGPRLLSTGLTDPRHETGSFFDTDRSLEFSITIKAGRGDHRRKGHAYGGLSLILLQNVQRWNKEVTILATGEQFRDRGSRQTWHHGFIPVLGYRTRVRKGCFFVEARSMILREIGAGADRWQLRYGAMLGYLRQL